MRKAINGQYHTAHITGRLQEDAALKSVLAEVLPPIFVTNSFCCSARGSRLLTPFSHLM